MNSESDRRDERGGGRGGRRAFLYLIPRWKRILVNRFTDILQCACLRQGCQRQPRPAAVRAAASQRSAKGP